MVSCQALSDSFVMRWTIVFQASLFLGFPRQEYGGGLPFPSPEDLPNTGNEPQSPTFQVVSGIAGGLWHCWRSLALQAVSGIAGGLWHCWRSLALLALQAVSGIAGGLWHYRRSLALLAISGIAGGLWHCRRSLALLAVCTAGGLWHCRRSLALQAESLPTKPPGEPR